MMRRVKCWYYRFLVKQFYIEVVSADEQINQLNANIAHWVSKINAYQGKILTLETARMRAHNSGRHLSPTELIDRVVFITMVVILFAAIIFGTQS